MEKTDINDYNKQFKESGLFPIPAKKEEETPIKEVKKPEYDDVGQTQTKEKNQTLEDKKAYLDKLYYDIGKQTTDFRLCYTYMQDNEQKFTKWKPYLQVQADEYLINKVNQRELLHNEIVLDLDDKNKDYDTLIQTLKDEKIKFYAYKTKENRARHIHTYWVGLSEKQRNRREELRLFLIKKFGCDEQLKSDKHVIPIEFTPHWKTGEIKKLYSSQEGINDINTLEEELEIIKQTKTKDQEIIKTLSYLVKKDRDRATEEIVSHILGNEKIVTIRDDKSSEVWIYKEGIYQPNGASFIKEHVRNLTADNYTYQIYSQVFNKIQADTFTEQEQFFKIDDPYKIAVQNGIIGLKTGEIEGFSPDKIHFNKLPVTYDKTKKCPAIIQHLKTVMANTTDVLVIQELIGYMLLRNYKYEKAFMLLGDGRNGKGKTIELIKRFLGMDNVCNVSLNTIEKNNFALSIFHNKMANLCGDLSKGVLTETNNFKQLTGGDVVTADRKNKTQINFINYAKMVFLANELPITTDLKPAFFDRWILLDFPFTFYEKQKYDQLEDKTGYKIRDPEIIEKISTPEELSGLLNWAIQGLKRLEEKKQFSHSATTEQTKDQWLRRSSSVNAFCIDHLEESSDFKISKSELRNVYSQYCRIHKLKPATDKTIKNQLIELFGVSESHPRVDGEKTRCWDYVKFKCLKKLGLEQVEQVEQGFSYCYTREITAIKLKNGVPPVPSVPVEEIK